MWSRNALGYAVASLAYALILIALTYPLVLHPGRDAAQVEGAGLTASKRNDQMLSIAGASRNARAILAAAPSRLLDNGLCHPTPRAATLGEHLIEPTLLGLPVHALSGNPVLAYSFSVLASFVIAGLSMLALVRHFSGSWLAGFVAGTLFAFHPFRLYEIGHLHVIGLHWLPLVLLFFERLARSGRARDAAWLACFGVLQSWVGAYPLLILAAFALPYGALRIVLDPAWRARRQIGLLAAAVAASAIAAGAVLLPYALAGPEGALLERRQLLLTSFGSLLPGGTSSLGGGALLLAAIALAAARRGGGLRRSPVPALLAALLACLLLAANGPLWPGAAPLSGLYPWLADRFWLLGIVRVPAVLRLGALLALALLAGLGLAALGRARLRAPLRSALVAGATAWLAVELFVPAVALRVYGLAPRLRVVGIAPSADLLETYRALDVGRLPGAVMELPYPLDASLASWMSRYTMLAAYHERPTAACFNSHMPPSYMSLARIAARLPQRQALEELSLVGIRNLVLWRPEAAPWAAVLDRSRLAGEQERLISALSHQPGVSLVHAGVLATAFHIELEVDHHSNTALLCVAGARRHPEPETGHLMLVDLDNRGDTAWRLPDPGRLLEAELRFWQAEREVERRGVRLQLPLALSAGSRDVLFVELGPSPAGCLACTPQLVVSDLGWDLWPEASPLSPPGSPRAGRLGSCP